MRPVALPVLFAVTLLTALAGPPAWAQYRWKDANGQVHASDLPPPHEIPDKDILQRPTAKQRPVVPVGSVASPAPGPMPGRPAPSAAAPSLAASAAAARPASGPVDPTLDARRKQSEAEARSRARNDEERQAALRTSNCQRARDQLATLDSGQRLARPNAQGERMVLDEAARANESEAARRVIASDCR